MHRVITRTGSAIVIGLMALGLVKTTSAQAQQACHNEFSVPTQRDWSCGTGTHCGANFLACWQNCPAGWQRCGCSCMPPRAQCCGSSNKYCAAPSYCGPPDHGALYSWNGTCVGANVAPQLYFNPASFGSNSPPTCRGTAISYNYPPPPAPPPSGLINSPPNRNAANSTCNELENSARKQFQETQQEADQQWEQAQDMRRKGPALQNNNEEYQDTLNEIRTFDNEARSTLSDLDQKIENLVTERDAALKELREGFFCSKCMRTATEIEREEHVSFQAHLGQVQGQAVPAPPEVIYQRETEYGQKIAGAEKDYDDELNRDQAHDTELRDKIPQLQQEHAQIIAIFDSQVRGLETQARGIFSAGQAQYANAIRQVAQCRLASSNQN